MGFKREMIEALFESEDEIEDVNHAAELLVPKNDGTWVHKFSKNPFTQLCKVCNCYAMDHLQERNRNILEVSPHLMEI
jgi:SOS response regulatory protein OraA/RecX